MLFEKAVRNKLRFKTSKGVVTSECLWDMKLTDLDMLAQSLREEVKQSKTKSFLDTPSVKDTSTQLRFEIVKHVITVLLEEKAQAVQAGANRAEKQKLLKILDEKEDADLRGMSKKDLKKMVSKL